ncbi:NAD-binding protein [Blautia sp. Sow4_E7]
MQIIIVGCGKVGRTLAEQLQEEDTATQSPVCVIRSTARRLDLSRSVWV